MIHVLLSINMQDTFFCHDRWNYHNYVKKNEKLYILNVQCVYKLSKMVRYAWITITYCLSECNRYIYVKTWLSCNTCHPRRRCTYILDITQRMKIQWRYKNMIHDTAHDTYTYRGTVGKCWGYATLEGHMMGGEVWTPRTRGPRRAWRGWGRNCL